MKKIPGWKQVIWYLKSLDPGTNEALATELPEENLTRIPDTRGIVHDVWRCDVYETVKKFERAKKAFHFQFEVFRSVDGSDRKYIQRFVRPTHRKGTKLVRRAKRAKQKQVL